MIEAEIGSGSVIEPSEKNFDLIVLWLNTYKPADRTRRFLTNIERRIKDPIFFWQLFRNVVIHANASRQFLEHFEKAMSKEGRMEVPQLDRIAKSSSPGMTSDTGRPADEETLRIFNELPDEIIAYRGFLVSGDKRVRSSRDRNSPLYHIQDEGRGYSFTLDKNRAIKFAARSAHHYADKLQPLKRAAERTLSKRQKCYEFYYRGGTPYFAEYRIPKEKVILIMPERGEDEVFVNPDDAYLVKYIALNAGDIKGKFHDKYPQDFPLPENFTYDPNLLADLWGQLIPPCMD